MISFEHNFIFFELQKTASTAMCSTLFSIINIEREKRLCPPALYHIVEQHETIYRRRQKMGRGLWRDGHYPPEFYQKNLESLIIDHYGGAENSYDKFVKFGVIRNPWDRFLSAYSHSLSIPTSRRDEWAVLTRKKMKSFQDFDDFCLNCDKDDFFLRGHFNSHVNFYKGSMGSTHFLRYENLQKEFRNFARDFLGFPLNLLAKINVSPNRQRDYRLHYSPKSRDIVSQRYKDDIEAFGFEF